MLLSSRGSGAPAASRRGLRAPRGSAQVSALNKVLFDTQVPPRRGKTALSVEQGLILRLAARAAATSGGLVR